MSPTDPVSTGPHQDKPKGTRKPKGKPATEHKGKRSLNLSIPHDDHERLAVHALRMGLTISDLVCQLARQHLREFHISRTANRTEAGQEAA